MPVLDFFFWTVWSSEALPAKMGSVISGATVWARHGVDGFHDAGMINPASAGRSKRKFEGCERLSELRSPAVAHRGWAEATPRGARQRRAQWESAVGTACETGPRTHGTGSRKAHGMGRGRGRSGSVRFPGRGAEAVGRHRTRGGTPLSGVSRVFGFHWSRLVSNAVMMVSAAWRTCSAVCLMSSALPPLQPFT